MARDHPGLEAAGAQRLHKILIERLRHMRVVRAMMPMGIMERVTTGSSACRRCWGSNTLKVPEPPGPIPVAAGAAIQPQRR